MKLIYLLGDNLRQTYKDNRDGTVHSKNHEEERTAVGERETWDGNAA